MGDLNKGVGFTFKGKDANARANLSKQVVCPPSPGTSSADAPICYG